MTDEIIEKLEAELKDPEGFSSYKEVQLWLASCCETEVAYRTILDLGALSAKREIKSATPRKY